MLRPAYAEIVIEAIQNILESKLAELLGYTEVKHDLARQALLDEAGLPSPLPLILTLDKSGLLRQLYNEALARVDNICHDDALDVSQKQVALEELAAVIDEMREDMMIADEEAITTLARLD